MVTHFHRQYWSFMQCCSGNFLIHSWHKLCNVDAVKLNRFSENQPVLQLAFTDSVDTKSGQYNFIYPYSVILAPYI